MFYDRGSDAVVLVIIRHKICRFFHILIRIAHSHGKPGCPHKAEIIVAVSDRHRFFPRYAQPCTQVEKRLAFICPVRSDLQIGRPGKNDPDPLNMADPAEYIILLRLGPAHNGQILYPAGLRAKALHQVLLQDPALSQIAHDRCISESLLEQAPSL